MTDDLTVDLEPPESAAMALREVTQLIGAQMPDTAYVDTVAADVLGATMKVRADLVALREHKAAVNKRIKRLVAFEGYLTRMSRIADELLGEEVKDDDGTDEPPDV